MCILLFFLLLYIFTSNNLVEGQINDTQTDKESTDSIVEDNDKPVSSSIDINITNELTHLINGNNAPYNKFSNWNANNSYSIPETDTAAETTEGSPLKKKNVANSYNELLTFINDKFKKKAKNRDQCFYTAQYYTDNDETFQKKLLKYFKDCINLAYVGENKIKGNIDYDDFKKLEDEVKFNNLKRLCLTANILGFSDKKCDNTLCKGESQIVNNDTTCHFNYDNKPNNLTKLNSTLDDMCVYNEYGNQNTINKDMRSTVSYENRNDEGKQCCIDKEICNVGLSKYESNDYHIGNSSKWNDNSNYCQTDACNFSKDATKCGLSKNAQCSTISQEHDIINNEYFSDGTEFYKKPKK